MLLCGSVALRAFGEKGKRMEQKSVNKRKWTWQRVVVSVIIVIVIFSAINGFDNLIRNAWTSLYYPYGTQEWAIVHDRAESGIGISQINVQYENADEFYVGIVSMGNGTYPQMCAGVKKDGNYSEIGKWELHTRNTRNLDLDFLYIYKGEEHTLVVADTIYGTILDMHEHPLIESISAEDEEGNVFEVVEDARTEFKVFYRVYDKEDFPENLKVYSVVNGVKTLVFDCE